MKNRTAALSAGRIHVDNSGVNCYNKSVEPRRLPHWTFHNDEGLPSKPVSRLLQQTAHFSLRLKSLSQIWTKVHIIETSKNTSWIVTMYITPFEENPRESLYIAPSFPLPRVVRQPSIFTSTMVVAEFHNQHFI